MSRDIRVVLVTPHFMFFDPFHMALGVTLEELLEDALDGKVQRGVGGRDRYPLRLSEGSGAEVALGGFGELAFCHLCCAKHKLCYAEPRSMRSARAIMGVPSGSGASATPHNKRWTSDSGASSGMRGVVCAEVAHA